MDDKHILAVSGNFHVEIIIFYFMTQTIGVYKIFDSIEPDY